MVQEVSQFENKHYDIILQLEQKFSDDKSKKNLIEQFRSVIGPNYNELTKNIDMLGLFSLAKTKNDCGLTFTDNIPTLKRTFDQ
jgi:hypothetical protein